MKCTSIVQLDYMDAIEFHFEDGTFFSISRFDIYRWEKNGGKLQDLLINKYYELIKERTLEEQRKLKELEK